MQTKELINQNLKKAMLSGEKQTVNVLKSLKTALLYAEVESGKRELGLSEDEISTVLRKEAKKRAESAQMYSEGGSKERADLELFELSIIKQYLPEEMGADELNRLIDGVLAEISPEPQNMGKIIAAVKQKAGSRAEGGKIAAEVKNRIIKQ